MDSTDGQTEHLVIPDQHWQEIGDVELKAVVHLPCAGEIAAFKVKQADSSVNESLKERAFRTCQVGPQIFKHIVAGEELLRVKQVDTFLDTRVIRVESCVWCVCHRLQCLTQT